MATANECLWGGVSFWRSLMQLDLIDEFRLDLQSYRLAVVSSTEFSNGTVGLHYRRHR